jgi:hypothetical protein
MKKIFVFLVIMVFAFVSCSLEDVYDDDSAIINNADKYLQQKSVGNNYGNVFTQNVTGAYTGLRTIRTIKNNGTIIFDVSLTINSGRLKLVLVNDKDAELIIVCDQNVSKTFEFTELDGKYYKLKLVGDEATFDLRINF